MESIALDRAFVRVAGADAESYLQGQLSQDLGERPVGLSLLLEPTGKVCALLRYQRVASDAFLLDTDAEAGEAVLGRLRRFLLRTKAAVEPEEHRVVRVFGSAGPAGVVAPWPPGDGAPFDLVDEEPPPDGTTLDRGDHERRRILAGVPVSGVDIGPDTIPAEAGLWVIESAVSFTKGCYTGQELVARIDSRGSNVPRPLRVLQSVDGAPLPTGGEVVVDGATVGRLTSASADVALGPVARKVAPGDAVVAGGVGATVVR